MPDIWVLYRSHEHPRVGNFDTEQDAQDWADEYGLVDWRPLHAQRAPIDLFDGQKHEQVCSVCDEPWPCRVQKTEWKAQRLTQASRDACAKCGKGTSWVRITVPGGGLLGEDAVYCGKLGACRNAGLRELERLGLADHVERYERERRERSEDLKRRKAMKAELTATWRAGIAVRAADQPIPASTPLSDSGGDA